MRYTKWYDWFYVLVMVLTALAMKRPFSLCIQIAQFSPQNVELITPYRIVSIPCRLIQGGKNPHKPNGISFLALTFMFGTEFALLETQNAGRGEAGIAVGGVCSLISRQFNS